jgi:hypothetical protein
LRQEFKPLDMQNAHITVFLTDQFRAGPILATRNHSDSLLSATNGCRNPGPYAVNGTVGVRQPAIHSKFFGFLFEFMNCPHLSSISPISLVGHPTLYRRPPQQPTLGQDIILNSAMLDGTIIPNYDIALMPDMLVDKLRLDDVIGQSLN